MKFKIAKEVAEAEFDRMCVAFRIDCSTDELDEKELAEWTEVRGKIVQDLRTGALVVGEDGKPTYTPPVAGADSLTFHPPTGATLMALETYAGEKGISNLVAAMADMTRRDRGLFGKMARPDFQVCSRLAGLFLADR